MSAPLSASFSSSRLSWAAARPTAGSAPAPRPARRLRADVDLHVGVRHQERLRIGVHGDELDAAETGVDHAVDGVRAAAADADDLDRLRGSCRLRLSSVSTSSLDLKLESSIGVVDPRFRMQGTSPPAPCQRESQGVGRGWKLDLYLRVEVCPGDRTLGNAHVEVASSSVRRGTIRRASSSFSARSEPSPRRISAPERSTSVSSCVEVAHARDPCRQGRPNERRDRTNRSAQSAGDLVADLHLDVRAQPESREPRPLPALERLDHPAARRDEPRRLALAEDGDGSLGHDDHAQRVRERAVEARSGDGWHTLDACLQPRQVEREQAVSARGRENGAHLVRDVPRRSLDGDLVDREGGRAAGEGVRADGQRAVAAGR